MKNYRPLSDLLAMLRARDLDALYDELQGHFSLDQMLYGLAASLRADQALADGLRARAKGYLLAQFEVWLARETFDGQVVTERDFRALATARAHALDASLPRFDDVTLSYAHGYCASVGSWHWADGDRAASLSIESRDVGPAEVIHEEAWRAEYRSAAGHRRLRFDASGSMPTMCWEEVLDVSVDRGAGGAGASSRAGAARGCT